MGFGPQIPRASPPAELSVSLPARLLGAFDAQQGCWIDTQAGRGDLLSAGSTGSVISGLDANQGGLDPS